MAGEGIIEAIETQIRDNDPPETRITLDRLMSLGESRNNAMRFIGAVMAQEMFELLQNKQQYNEDRYVANLKNLPEMPFDD